MFGLVFPFFFWGGESKSQARTNFIFFPGRWTNWTDETKNEMEKEKIVKRYNIVDI